MITRLLLNLIVAALLVALTAEYGGRAIGLIERLEQTSYDWRLVADAEQAGLKNEDIVIVDIDRDSLRSLGSWPWHRGLLADLADSLYKNYNVRAAAFSFPFPDENDDTVAALGAVEDELLMQNDDIDPIMRRQLTVRLANITRQYDYDTLFANALQNKVALLGYVFDESGRTEAALPEPTPLHSPGEPPTPISPNQAEFSMGEFPFMRGYSGNIRKLTRAARGGGHLNVELDLDGVVRRAPSIIKHGNGYYESLALALMRNDDITGKGFPLLLSVNSDGKAEAVSTSRYSAKIDQDSMMLLRFGNTGGRFSDFDNTPSAAFRYISARDVIRERAQKRYLEDKIVIVGSSSELLRDIYPTPVNAAMPLAEIIASQIASARRNDTLFRNSSTRLVELIALSGAALVLAIVSVFLGPFLGFLLTAAFAGGAVYLIFQQWDVAGEVFRLTPPLIVFVGVALVNALSGFVFEWIKGKQLKSAFSQYVPPELAQRVGKTINMEGESREISVLFSDIRDFTSISEKLTPTELTSLMNRMLTAQTRVIHQNGGTVDKFIGDAVMAFWNAPLDDAEHAKNSVAAAMGMQQALNRLSAEEVKAGRNPMRLGVGICTGIANVGNMGSEFRVAYTALGDTVNVSSRVEGLTKYYGVPILVTESTKDKCGDSIVFRTVDLVRVKGREQALAIFEPLGHANLVPSAIMKSMEAYNQMRAAYLGGDFEGARDLLAKYDEEHPQDGLTAFYRNRIDVLLKSPPAEWDGVTVFESK